MIGEANGVAGVDATHDGLATLVGVWLAQVTMGPE
jgi:hypothetical protein